MIVLLELIFVFSVTFAIEENNNDVDFKRFGDNSWQYPVENNFEDPILASISQVDSNLLPIMEPFLGLIFNKYDTPIQPYFAYFSDDAQEHLTTNSFYRKSVNEIEKEIIFYCDSLECPSKTHSCETTVQAISENNFRLRTATLCLSRTYEILRRTVTSSRNHTSGMFYYENQNDEKDPEMDGEENIFYCLDLPCPSETHSCKTSFHAVNESVIKMEAITQCLSIIQEVLDEKTTRSNFPLNDRFYFELKAIDHKNVKSESKKRTFF